MNVLVKVCKSDEAGRAGLASSQFSKHEGFLLKVCFGCNLENLEIGKIPPKQRNCENQLKNRKAASHSVCCASSTQNSAWEASAIEEEGAALTSHRHQFSTIFQTHRHTNGHGHTDTRTHGHIDTQTRHHSFLSNVRSVRKTFGIHNLGFGLTRVCTTHTLHFSLIFT